MRHGCLLAGLSLAMGVASFAQAETFSFRVGSSVTNLRPMEGYAAVYTGGPAPTISNAEVKPLRTGWYSVYRHSYDSIALADELVQNPTVKYASPYFKGDNFGFQIVTPGIIVRTQDQTLSGANAKMTQLTRVATDDSVISAATFGAEAMPFMQNVKLDYRSFRQVLELANRWNSMNGVRYAIPNRMMKAQPFFPNDPLAPQQWYRNYTGQNGGDPVKWIDIKLDAAWAITTGSNSIQVAVLDDGIGVRTTNSSGPHPDIRVGDSKDFIDPSRLGRPTDPFFDTHGTEMAGLISATINNSIGIAGVAGGTRSASLKIIESGFLTIDDFVEAMNFVIAKRYPVTVFGYALAGGDAAITDAYDLSRNAFNTIHFAADAGYPANEDSVLGVGAMDWQQTLFNTESEDIFICGPGAQLMTTNIQGGYSVMQGSPSGATAIMGAIAALMKSVNPSLGAQDIQNILAATAQDITFGGEDDPLFGYDDRSGWGMVNAARAVAAAGFGSINVPAVIYGGEDVEASIDLLFDPAPLYVQDPEFQLNVRVESSDEALLAIDGDNPVLMDQQSVDIDLVSTGVNAERSVRITGYVGNVARATMIRVLPSRLRTFTVASTNAFSNDRILATVTTEGTSGSEPRGFTVRSSDRSVVDTAQSVFVPANQNRTTWNLICKPVTATRQATITASLGGVSISRTITVRVPPAVLQNFTLDPSVIESGYSPRGTVTLAAPATQNVSVAIQTNNNAVLPPGPRGIAAGGTSATFLLPTALVNANTIAIVTARLGQQTKSTTLTLKPALRLEELTITPVTVRGGFETTGRVRIFSPAPTGGRVVTLSDNSSFATVPTSVTIPAGRTFVDFTITTRPVAQNVTVWVTAKTDTITKTTSFSIVK